MGYLDRLRTLFDRDDSAPHAEGRTRDDTRDHTLDEERSPQEHELIGQLQRRLADEAEAQKTVRFYLLFSGRVQGVGFRWTNQGTAQELGLTGWVRNLPDGTVAMELQGTPGRLIRHLDTLHARYRRMGCRIWLERAHEQNTQPEEREFGVTY